ncbi:MAG: SCO family protein [Acidobacteriota bacterium]|nr:MAG: SCO family protein [Acidobacteriota bacterium]
MDTLHQLSGRLIVAALCATALLLLGACKSGPPKASEGAQRFEIRGKVIAADQSRLEVTIAHEEIPGYMEAMTMPFKLYDEWVYGELKNGAQIQATLVVDGERTWLENPIVTTVADPSLINKEETGVEPEVGAALPPFELTNQNGKKIRLSDYRGSALLVTFIYTRCPLPDYCPLMSRNFAEIDRMVRASNPIKARLISVSIDPTYDTPEVLKKYAAYYLPADRKDDFSTWEFATGTPEQIKSLARFFGLNYWPEKDQIIHGLRTAIISPDGKIHKIYRGNDWTPDQVMQDLKRL